MTKRLGQCSLTPRPNGYDQFTLERYMHKTICVTHKQQTKSLSIFMKLALRRLDKATRHSYLEKAIHLFSSRGSYSTCAPSCSLTLANVNVSQTAASNRSDYLKELYYDSKHHNPVITT